MSRSTRSDERAGEDATPARLAPPPEPTRSGILTGTGGHGIWYGAWSPAGDGPDRGVVVLAHGFGEYTGRYGHLIRGLTSGGYSVVAPEHRGHGRSEGTRFRIARFDDFVADLDLVMEIADEVAGRRGVADLPPFLFGHSMGGLIATRYVLAMPDQGQLSGLILSAPALQLAPDLTGLPLRLAGLLARVAPGFPVKRAHGGGLSSDPAVDRLWAADPLLNHGSTAIQMAYQITVAGQDARRRLRDIRLPLYLVYGEADRVVDVAGCRALAATAGSADLTVRALPGRLHEPLNEPDGDETLREVVAWLDAHAPEPAGRG